MPYLHAENKQHNGLKTSQVCKRVQQQINNKQRILQIQNPLVAAHQHSDSSKTIIVKC